MRICIYKIYNDEMAYIGSSKNFKDRMKKHKTSCYNENDKGYNYFIYQYIRTHGGWDAFEKEIIHECDVEDETEQRIVEQEFIKNNECKLNDRRSYTTDEEKKEQQKQYYETNKEKLKEYHKQYYETNKEKLKEQKKQYYETIKEKRKQKITCDCGSIIQKGDKAKHERSIKHKNFLAENNIIPMV